MATTKAEQAQIEHRLARAVNHPVRLRTYSMLAERTASPNEVSREIGEPLGNVSYHVRVLEELDVIELVETKPRRGATEHFYRATLRPDLSESEWASMPLGEREAFSQVGIQLLFADMMRAASEGTLDKRIDRTMARNLLQVDEEGWAELFAICEAAFKGTREVAARVAARQVEHPTETTPVTLALCCFERAPKA